MTPLQPSADNLAAVNSDAPEVAVDLDDRLRAAYVKAHDAEEAWLESTGHLYDPSLPIDAGIRAVLREVQAHPSRGVVDEVALAEVIQDHTGCGDSDSIYAAHAVTQHLQAAALPAVPADTEWREAFVEVSASRYRDAGMKIEAARIHAEVDANQLEIIWRAKKAATPAHDQPEGEG